MIRENYRSLGYGEWTREEIIHRLSQIPPVAAQVMVDLRVQRIAEARQKRIEDINQETIYTADELKKLSQYAYRDGDFLWEFKQNILEEAKKGYGEFSFDEKHHWALYHDVICDKFKSLGYYIRHTQISKTHWRTTIRWVSDFPYVSSENGKLIWHNC